MILFPLNELPAYVGLHPGLKCLADYLATHPIWGLSDGRHEVDGSRLYLNVEVGTLVEPRQRRLEVHRRYMDLHLPLSGPEIIGWTPSTDLGTSDEPFDEARDIAFYTQEAQTYVRVMPGQALLLMPGEGHAPLVGSGQMRKVIAKLLVED